MNKFKKPNEYPEVKQVPAPAFIGPVLPMEAPKPTAWECVGCDNVAVVLHRGTGYCRTCYDNRNLVGKLID